MTIYKDYSLSGILWYKIGGIAKYLLQVKNKEEIIEALSFIKENRVSRVLVVGLGSNLIFTDEYFDGAVIQLTPSDYKSFKVGGSVVESFGGEILDDLINFSLDNNLVGLEWAGGLPGTVGAAVRGNVGAFGGEIKDYFLEAEVIDTNTLEIKTLNKEDLNFSYRDSLIKKEKNFVVISAKFQLSKGNRKKVDVAKDMYYANINYRREKHPLEHPNTGSVFKNITEKGQVEKVLSVWPDIKEKIENNWYGKVSMGYMIERLGLSGKKIGGAQISTKHPNFIVNLGGAKASEVIALIDEVKANVGETFEFTPEVEAEIVEA